MAAAPFVVVLGIAQDGGYPQAGCRAGCCERAWLDPSLRRSVACLGLVDPASGERFLVDATPDLPRQLHLLTAAAGRRTGSLVDGVLVTHAHVGHYTGLIHLGREAAAARGVPVYTLPRMRRFLRSNSPWRELQADGHIELRSLEAGQPIKLGARLAATPVLVRHRGEHSETVGFRLHGPSARVTYVPDVDALDGLPVAVEDELAASDALLLDGTFYGPDEFPGRDLSAIPHPFVAETMARLVGLAPSERRKVRFVHLNHTNPLLRSDSVERRAVVAAGFRIAEEGERHAL